MSLKSMLIQALGGGLLALSALTAQAAPLHLDVYNPGEASVFPVTSTLITGEREALLIDAQFQRDDAQALVDKIRASGKTLTTIYISHSDPDYYFGLDLIHAAFPAAKILATGETRAKILDNKDRYLEYWGPILKDNAPRQIIVPDAMEGDQLALEGKSLNVIGLDGPAPERTVLWIPSLKTVLGGVPVSANIHVWIADTQTETSRSNWLTLLEQLQALNPDQVIPGHYLPNADGTSPFDGQALAFTRDYLTAFESEAARADNAADLITAMQRRYPTLEDSSSLELSAKVIKGEMSWP